MSRIEYDPPVEAGVLCYHCSREIQAVAQIMRGLQIAGLNQYEWTHVENGKAECPPIIRTARPSDGWQATSATEQALRARRAAEDALQDALEAPFADDGGDAA